MPGEKSIPTPSRTPSPVAHMPSNSASPPRPPNNPAPAREEDVNRYIPDNVFARITYGPSDIYGRLDRLDNETDRLVNIFTGAANPTIDPVTVTDHATVTDLSSFMNGAANTGSAASTDSATDTERASVTGSAAPSESTTGTDEA